MKKNKKSQNFPKSKTSSEMDDTYSSQKRYHRTKKGKRALEKARKAYDDRDPERRRRQKREYMKRRRAEKKAGLREY